MRRPSGFGESTLRARTGAATLAELFARVVGRRSSGPAPRRFRLTTKHQERRCAMSYLSKHGTRRVPQWLPLARPGREQRGRSRLGGRCLDAAPPLPDPRLRGRFVLRVRVDADARERHGRRGRRSRQTACARSRRSSPSAGRAARRRTIRRSTHSHWPQASATTRRGRQRSRRCRRSPARARTCSSSRRSSRASAAGAARCVERLPAGTPTSRSSRSPTRRSSTASGQASSHRDLLRLAHPAGRVGAGNPTRRRHGRSRSPVRVDRPRR